MNKVIDTSKFFYEADVKGSLLKIKKKHKARACDRDCQNSNKNWTIDALTRNTK